MSSSLVKDSDKQAFFRKPPPVMTESNLPFQESVYTSAPAGAVNSDLSPLEKEWNSYLKRLFDLLFSTILILVIVPWLFPLLALLIKKDSKGPVFFLQKRNKINGKVFTCIKFRTMLVNSDADYLPATENDQRITRLGKFLRDHHLDELPQVFNVWIGDMSIIGPRPHMISDNLKFEVLVPSYNFRHKVKPGITGLAQVMGHVGPVADYQHLRERVEKDIYYVTNWSVLLDLKIACHTFYHIISIR
jgi:putative colanic acid biosysnthesis UDP-glucose lipid carrier transferase